MEARELLMNRKLTLDERICKLRDIGVTINGVRYHYNFKQISDATGISRSVISQYCNGHIRIKPEQEKKLEEWVRGIEEHILAETPADETEEEPIQTPKEFKTKIELYQTREFKEALGLLEWTRENRKMCVMVGHPGIGKTTIIKEFSRRVPGVHVIVCRGTMQMRDLLDSIAESIGITAGGSNDERVRRIQRELKNRDDAMLIFDEADHIYDRDVSYEGVVVSPGNGFGIMDGGFDRVLRDVHGTELEKRIKRAIIRMYGPEMPVGCAVSSAATGGQRVIYAPTMQVPMELEGSDNVYRAARAAAHLAKTLSVRTLWMPLMGTGAGNLPLNEAVWQMAAGVIDGTAELTTHEMNWEHADRIHLQWHRFCRVPDDGVRFAELMKEAQEHGDAVENQADG